MITLKQGADARASILRGMKKLHDAVAATMGPSGRNMLFEERDRQYLTKDGAQTARFITSARLFDAFERCGAALLRRASQKTEEEAGDGTTAATVLAYQIALSAMEHVDEGANVMALERGMRKAYEHIDKHLQKIKKECTKREDWEKVAYISSRDKEVAEVIGKAMEEVGPDGYIKVEKGDDWKEHELELELKKGMTFPRGYHDPTAINNYKNLTCELSKVPILVTNLKLFLEKDASLLAALAEAVYKQGNREMVIIGDKFSGIIKDFILQNNPLYHKTLNNEVRQGMLILPIESPGHGTSFTDEFCDDISVLTGANLISKNGKSLEDVGLGDLGFCESIESSKNETHIVNDLEKNKEAVAQRIAEIEAQYEKAEGEAEKNRMIERKAALTTGMAVITVGGRNLENIGEKKDRVDDAVLATKAAHEDGIVPGAGIALFNAPGGLEKTGHVDENTGVEIIFEAILAPLQTIAGNCSIDILEAMAAARECKEWEALNFHLGTIDKVKAYEDGIVDPYKAVQSALLNAIETALIFVTTETVGVTLPVDKNHRPIFEVLSGDAVESVKKDSE